MKAGRKLDVLVAEKVMGLEIGWDEKTPCPYCGSVMRYCGTRSRCSECQEWRHSPYKNYSTDIKAAMEVLKTLLGQPGWGVVDLRWSGGTWGVMRPRGNAMMVVSGSIADTLPHAICLAALKAVEIDAQD